MIEIDFAEEFKQMFEDNYELLKKLGK